MQQNGALVTFVLELFLQLYLDSTEQIPVSLVGLLSRQIPGNGARVIASEMPFK